MTVAVLHENNGLDGADLSYVGPDIITSWLSRY